MGPRLAGILEYMLENYTQGTYSRLIALMIGEQVEELKQAYFNIKKMKFVSAKKKGDELTILMKVWPDKNTKDVKQADLAIHFSGGVSESQSANELFSYESLCTGSRKIESIEYCREADCYKSLCVGRVLIGISHKI